jgi:hypothetical protein
MEIGGVDFDHPLIPGDNNATYTISEAMTEVVENHARTFWTAVKSYMETRVTWDYISCNRIARTGRYAAPVSFERTVTPVVGTGGSGWLGPDASIGVSHLTAVRRGWASKGRVYLPLNCVSLSNPANNQYGSITPGTRNAIGSAWAAFLVEMNDLAVDLNTNIAGSGGLVVTGTRVGVFSPGTGKEQPRNVPGVWHAITGVRVGAQPDTQRRRLNKQPDLWDAGSNTYPVTT